MNSGFIYSFKSYLSILSHNAAKIPTCYSNTQTREIVCVTFRSELRLSVFSSVQWTDIYRTLIDKVLRAEPSLASCQRSQSSLLRCLQQVWLRPGPASAGTLRRVGTGRRAAGRDGRPPSVSSASQTECWPLTAASRPADRPSPGFYLRGGGGGEEVSLCFCFWELELN